MSKTTRLERDSYIHVLNQLTQLTVVICGPETFIKKDYEEIVVPATKSVHLPPNSYVIIKNPVVKSSEGVPEKDSNGYKLSWGETEVRTSIDYLESFPLYPGEINISKAPQSMKVISKDEAIRIKVLRDYTSSKGEIRQAGLIYQRQGPMTYIPNKEEVFLMKIEKTVVKKNEALRLKANYEFTDREGVARKTGEEWFYNQVGSFWPGVNELVLKVVKGTILTDKKAIHISALYDFTDQFGVERKAGDKWLVTNKMVSTFMPNVAESIIDANIQSVTLSNREYILVDNPLCVKTGLIQRGLSEIRLGEKTFFQHPNEIFHKKEKIPVLSEEQSLVLGATYDHVDAMDNKIQRKAGEKWLFKGPGEYHPTVYTTIFEKRSDVALDSTEGVYIRDLSNGEVRAVIGQNITLSADEEFWGKKLSQEAQVLVKRNHDKGEHYCVTYPVGENEAVCLFDFKYNTQRVVFGPELVMLQPNEEFKMMSLSGGVPKMEDYENKISLQQGQNNFDDEIVVVTQDHAALKLVLSYSGQFIRDGEIDKNPDKLFRVHDYIGIACKTMASRIRGMVSQKTYNEFHLKNTPIVKDAIFGKGKNQLLFEQNNFVITQCDVKKIEPADADIRKKLEKNTSISLDLKQKAQKLKFNLDATLTEESYKGELLVKTLQDNTAAEKKKVKFNEEVVKGEVIKKSGEEMAKAMAKAKSDKIKTVGMLEQTKSMARAQKIDTDAEIDMLTMEYKTLESNVREENKMEIEKKRKTNAIEIKRFKHMVESIGRDTIITMSKAGPENKARLLKSLGLEGYLVTDGKTPINLFNAAEGLVKR